MGLLTLLSPQQVHYLERFRANVGAAGSFDPTIVLAAGAPTPVWTVTDGAGVTVYSTAGITHVQSGAGDMSVSLGPPSILNYITQVTMDTDGLMGVFSQADLMRLPALIQILIFTNSSLVCRFSLSALPVAMTHLSPAATASVITGALSALPATMIHLNLNDTASAVTGALSALPATMNYLSMNNTAGAITGGATPIPAHGLANLGLTGTDKSQAQVDEIIARIYADRALFTAATPNLGIGGNNAAPSGVYQAANPPTTGKEKIWSLVVDSLGEGHHKWTITYTA